MQQLETRTLLAATLNGLADGRVIYSGSLVGNTLSVSYDGVNTYTLTDGGETISLLGTVAGGTGSGTGTVTFNAAALAAFTQLSINTGTGNDTITINSFRGGQEGLVVQNNAGDGTDTLNIVGDVGTAGSRVNSTGITLASDTINLTGDLFTNNLGITVGASGSTAPINLLDNVTINSGTALTSINGGSGANGVNGAFGLSVSGGSIQLRGDVGTGAALTSLTANATNAAGQLQVGTTGAKTSIASTGTVSLTSGTGGVLFNGDTVTSTAGDVTVSATTSSVNGQALAITGNNISFTGGISGAQNLTLNAVAGAFTTGGTLSLTGTGILNATATTNIDLNAGTGAAGGMTLTAPSITSAGSLQSSGGNVTVNGNITFDGAGSVTIFSGTASSVVFNGSVTGNASNFAIQRADSVQLLGSVSNVGSFSVTKSVAGTITDLILNNVTATDISATATTIRPRGDLTSTVGGMTLTGAVLLDGTDPTVTLTSGLGVGDAIVITGTVNDSGAPTNLELIAANDTNLNLDGSVTVTGAIGGVTPIQSLRVNGATVTLQAVDVTTGDITLGGGNLALNGNLSGSGANNNVIFTPNGVGGTLEIYNQASAPLSNNMTVDQTDLSRLTASIERMVFGSNTTGTVTLFSSISGVIVLPRNTEFRGTTVNLNDRIDQGVFTVDVFTDTLNITKALSGTGAFTLNKLVPGGNLVVNGNIGQGPWGANSVTVNNVGGTVTMNGHFGHDLITSITVNADTLNTSAQTSAISAAGNVTLNVGTLIENGGVFSNTGDILITGNVVSTSGPLTFLVPAGKNLQINGTVNAAGNITIRGRNGALNAVSLLGNVTTTGAFSIDSSGANTANLVNLVGSVNAGSIVVRGNTINLVNNLTATAGSVHLLGAVNLFNNIVMTSSGLAPHFVRVDGTIDGGFDLTSSSGLGGTHLVGVVGGVNPLANLNVTSGGFNYVYQNITVTGSVNWLVGDTANGGQDQLNVLSGKTITAGVAITLEADTVLVNAVTQLFAPTETVISNGGT